MESSPTQGPNNLLLIFVISFFTIGISIGGVYTIVQLHKQSIESTLIPIAKSIADLTTTVSDLQTQVAETTLNNSETKQDQNEQLPRYQAGETVLITENHKPWKCSKNGSPCEQTLVTTEIDLTEPSMGDQLTGRFYIRAYDGADYKHSPKIGELQITQHNNPFAGDGGGVPFERDTKELLTITSNVNPALSIVSIFESKFFLEYADVVPGWDMPGYVLHIDNLGETSEFNDRYVDFYYANDVLDITIPQ